MNYKHKGLVTPVDYSVVAIERAEVLNCCMWLILDFGFNQPSPFSTNKDYSVGQEIPPISPIKKGLSTLRPFLFVLLRMALLCDTGFICCCLFLYLASTCFAIISIFD